MVDPAGEFAHLIVVHSKLRFRFLKTLLDGPANAAQPYKEFEAGAQARIADEIGIRRGIIEGPSDDGQSGFITEFLKLSLPKPEPDAVASPAVRGDKHMRCSGVDLTSHGEPPATDGFDREGSRIVIDAYVYPARIVNEA
jgi:hypothetical protein